MVNKAKTQKSGIYVATLPVTPTKTSHNSREEEAHNHDKGQVVFVLPPYNFVPCQVANISNTGLATGLDDHPSNV
jgi:hypothetical protein